MEPLSAMLAVALERILDDRQGNIGRLDLVDLDRLSFQELVVLEEPAEHHQAVRGQLGGLTEAVELGVADGDGQDLVVGLAGVEHGHQADRPGGHQGHRRHGLLAEHQDVERVVVLGVRLGDEAVIGRVVDRRVEDPVEPEQAGLLVQLVLDARPHRDLDQGVELAREVLARGDVVPGMQHRVRAFAVEGVRAGCRTAILRGPIIAESVGGPTGPWPRFNAGPTGSPGRPGRPAPGRPRSKSGWPRRTRTGRRAR